MTLEWQRTTTWFKCRPETWEREFVETTGHDLSPAEKGYEVSNIVEDALLCIEAAQYHVQAHHEIHIGSESMVDKPEHLFWYTITRTWNDGRNDEDLAQEGEFRNLDEAKFRSEVRLIELTQENA